mgnify:CR=1 FL=1
MAHKDILFHEDARQKLQRGVDTLANAVKVTLGQDDYRAEVIGFLLRWLRPGV